MTATVTLQVWRVRRRDVPAALVASRLTARRLRRHGDVTFAKILGTSSDLFVPKAATPRRWATLICRRSGETLRDTWWETHSIERASLMLQPLSSHGSWDGQAPFDVDVPVRRGWRGPVVVLTRSTLRTRAARRFYRAVPPVAAELRAAAGCRVAFGIGETPLLHQGTISVWDSADAMTAFAYGCPQHAAVVAATPTEDWYAEQMFTRFALVDAWGTINGSRLV